jgi:hypothetical protein
MEKLEKTDILFLKTEHTRWHQFCDFYVSPTAYTQKEWEDLLDGIDTGYGEWDEEEKWNQYDELLDATEEEKYAFLLKMYLDIHPMPVKLEETLKLGETVAVREYYYYQSDTVQLYKIKELL